MKRFLGSFCMVLAAALSAILGVGAVEAQTLSIPTAMTPNEIANTTLTTAGTYLPAIITVSLVIVIGVTVFRVIKGGVRRFGGR